ncbi:adhesion G protein-coupled receptor B1-like [Amphiura filiformis]|uniref:adhesion G protein-coupled receptor B1-like n=1 Tax=Amphiura filiformis TaxID=82378 RepID=UPI003B214B4E
MERLLYLLILPYLVAIQLASVTLAQNVFQFEAAAYEAVENEERIDVIILRSGGTSMATVDITTMVINGQPLGFPNSISFGAGQVSFQLGTLFADNQVQNGDIVATLTLSNPSSGTIGPIGTTTVTITDDEQPVFSWSQWGQYSTCPVTCGGGSQTRTRTCTDAIPDDIGMCTPGSSEESMSCNTQSCATDVPVWGQWGQYSTCPVSCGGGSQTRTRTCTDANPDDGVTCTPGASEDQRSCNTQSCATDVPVWGQWGDYSTCTVSCGGGSQTRTRTCTNPDDGVTCTPGASEDQRSCNTQSCVTNTGVFFQHPSYTEMENVGKFKVAVERTTFDIEVTVDITATGDIVLSASQITLPIGVNRVEIEITVIDDMNPEADIMASLTLSNPSVGTIGNPGTTTITITDDDGGPSIPVGTWSSWGAWSDCSVTCGNGAETRIRRCTGSAQDCIGDDTDSRICDAEDICPEWTDWGQWSGCSLTCGGGSRRRTRSCNSFGTGASCQGSSADPGECNTQKCPGRCQSEVEVTPYGRQRTPDDQPVGTIHEAETLCPWYTINEGNRIGRATCVERNDVTFWEWTVDCGGEKEDLTVIVTPDNVNDVLDDVMDITGRDIEPEDVSNVIDILKDVVDLELPDREITDKVVDIIDNLCQVNPNVLREAQKMNPPTSEAVEVVERQFKVVQIQRPDIGDWPYRRVTNNVAAEVYQVSNEELCNGVYAASSSGPGVSSNKLLTRERQSSTDVDVEIEVPPAICNQYPNGTRVILDVLVSDKLLPSTDLQTVNEAQNNYDRVANSPVISVTVGNQEVWNLQEPVRLVFTPLEIHANNTECVFWDTILKDWSSEGCRYLGETPNWQRICECDHLTNFAVLMDIYGGTAITKTQAFILEILTYVGCCLSILGLGVTLITYCTSRKLKSKRPNQILMGLSSTLLGLYVVFVILISIDTDREKAELQVVACSVLAGILHYFTLASLCWMAVEGYNMYLMFVKVINSYVPHLIIKASVFAWGVPLVIVVVTGAVARGDYARTDFCFLQKWPLVGGVLVPIGLIILFNIIIFVLVMVRLSRESPATRIQAKRKGLRVRRLRNAVCIMTLMGLTWIIGYLSIIKAASFFSQLVFCLLNAMQGYVIFMCYCVQQADVRNYWRELCGTIRPRSKPSFFSSSKGRTSREEFISSNRRSGSSADDAVLINGNSAI